MIPNKEELHQQVMDAIHDLVADFMYYNRKEDEFLNVSELQDAFDRDIVTIDSLTAEFKKCMEEYINDEVADNEQ